VAAISSGKNTRRHASLQYNRAFSVLVSLPLQV